MQLFYMQLIIAAQWHITGALFVGVRFLLIALKYPMSDSYTIATYPNRDKRLRLANSDPTMANYGHSGQLWG